MRYLARNVVVGGLFLGTAVFSCSRQPKDPEPVDLGAARQALTLSDRVILFEGPIFGGGGGSGGSASGGKNAGGAATGGSATGGKATGGSATGGKATGGKASGGSGGSTGTGGKATGGTATGGSGTGGGVSDWSTTSGTISASASIKAEGNQALSIIGSSNPTLKSIAIGPLGRIQSPAGLEVWLPPNLQGLGWQGQVSLSFNSAASGISDQRSDWTTFSNMTTGSFQHVNITLPSALVASLSSSTANDLQIGILLQLSDNSQAAYLDKLYFPPASGGTGGAGGGQGGSAGLGGSAGRAGSGGTPACSPADCNDNNACTTDVCSSGACTHSPVTNGTPCDDSNVCTQTDMCQNGTCTGANPVACTALDQCHDVGTCNPSTGCSNPAKPNGTGCNDGNACTQADTCQNGTCTGSPVTCTALDQCHDVGTCNISTGCSSPAKANGTGCNDGNACTQADSCQNGTCAGTPVTCTALDQCHDVGTCNAGTGKCSNPPRPAGTSCSDGNPANGVELCDGTGVCVPGSPPAGSGGSPGSGGAPSGVGGGPSGAGGNPGAAGACSGGSIQVTDVGDDPREIWEGKETLASGKRVTPRPKFTLTFSQPVQIDRLAPAVQLVGTGADLGYGTPGRCTGKRVPAVPHVPRLDFSRPGEAWHMTGGGLAESYPQDFNVFAFRDLSGIPNANGPVAAGRDIALQDGAFNALGSTVTGVVAGHNVTAQNGTILGNIYYGGTASIAQSVNAPGQRVPGSPIAFDVAQARLTRLSKDIAAMPVTGTTTTQSWGGVTFAGTQTAINVFSVSADALAHANTIQIQTPASAFALINVTGNALTVGNLGLSLSGATPSGVLWNLPDATSLTLFSVGFQGSVLAPQAAAEVTNASFAGTLVANNVVGNGAYSYAPFNGWSAFSLASQITFSVLDRLLDDCQYTLSVNNTAALNSAGACLSDAVNVSFLVADNYQPPLTRDSAVFRYDSSRRNIVSFKPWTGINTPVDRLASRYGADLGLRPNLDGLAAPTNTLKSPFRSDWEIGHYGQVYRGIPVVGHGVFVHQAQGFVRHAAAKLASGLNLDVTPSITKEAAIQSVLASLNLTSYPWVEHPNAYLAPRADLRIAAHTSNPSSADFRLLWRVLFMESGIPDLAWTDVDAQSGSALHTEGGQQQAFDCSTFDASRATRISQSDQAISAPTLYNGTAQIHANTYSQGPGGGGAANGGASGAGAGGGSGASNATANFLRLERYAPSHTITTYQPITGSSAVVWCDPGFADNSSPPWSDPSVKSAVSGHWAIEVAEGYAAGHLTFDGVEWVGVTGLEDHYATSGDARPVLEVLIDGNNNLAPLWDTSLNPLKQARIVLFPVCDASGGPGCRTTPPGWKQDLPSLDVVAHEFGHGVLASMMYRHQLTNSPNAPSSSNYSLWAYSGESGAIIEGFADIFGETVEANTDNQTTAPWCFGPNCWRNLQAPKQSDPDGTDATQKAKPDTYHGNYWAAGENVHVNCTLLGHWFYLLAHGESGVNDNHCPYSVAPFAAPQGGTAMDAAATFAFNVLANLADEPNFSTLRDATIAAHDVADAPDQSAQRSVFDAWRAVGVGPTMPTDVFPGEGVTVEPWPADLYWKPLAGAGATWQVQIAASQTDLVAETNLWFNGETADLRTTDGMVHLSVMLDAGITYYWRLRPKSMDAWSSDCDYSGSFKTKPKEATPLPRQWMKDGAYLVSSGPQLGSVNFELPQGQSGVYPETGLYAVVSPTQGACANPNDLITPHVGGWSPDPWTNYATTGVAPDWAITTGEGRGGITNPLQAGTTYYLAVMPVRQYITYTTNITGYSAERDKEDSDQDPPTAQGTIPLHGNCTEYPFQVADPLGAVLGSPGTTSYDYEKKGSEVCVSGFRGSGETQTTFAIPDCSFSWKAPAEITRFDFSLSFDLKLSDWVSGQYDTITDPTPLTPIITATNITVDRDADGTVRYPTNAYANPGCTASGRQFVNANINTPGAYVWWVTSWTADGISFPSGFHTFRTGPEAPVPLDPPDDPTATLVRKDSVKELRFRDGPMDPFQGMWTPPAGPDNPNETYYTTSPFQTKVQISLGPEGCQSGACPFKAETYVPSGQLPPNDDRVVDLKALNLVPTKSYGVPTVMVVMLQTYNGSLSSKCDSTTYWTIHLPAELGDVDDDGDGFTPDQGDCNDDDPTVHPGAPAACPSDKKDTNCDGKIDVLPAPLPPSLVRPAEWDWHSQCTMNINWSTAPDGVCFNTCEDARKALPLGPDAAWTEATPNVSFLVYYLSMHHVEAPITTTATSISGVPRVSTFGLPTHEGLCDFGGGWVAVKAVDKCGQESALTSTMFQYFF
jgi:choice-of-anchor A domain-containing protein